MKLRLPETSERSLVLLRRALLALGLAAVATTATELAMERHWGTFDRLIPWFGLGALLVVYGLLVIRPGRRSLALARLLILLVALSSLIGMKEHVAENLRAGSLDRDYAPTWDSKTKLDKLWIAVSMSAGKAPPLAPGVLAGAALCFGLATIAHPAGADEADPRET